MQAAQYHVVFDLVTLGCHIVLSQELVQALLEL
jgi:hypothetical protein